MIAPPRNPSIRPVVVIMDDNVPYQTSALSLLIRNGYNVRVYNNSDELLEDLQASTLDGRILAFILDNNTDDSKGAHPKGVDIIAYVHQAHPESQIILWSGDHSNGRFTGGEVPEYARFVPKPYPLKEIMAMINEHDKPGADVHEAQAKQQRPSDQRYL